jgi:hypothetical protein
LVKISSKNTILDKKYWASFGEWFGFLTPFGPTAHYFLMKKVVLLALLLVWSLL